jgi:hypothetical protein
MMGIAGVLAIVDFAFERGLDFGAADTSAEIRPAIRGSAQIRALNFDLRIKLLPIKILYCLLRTAALRKPAIWRDSSYTGNSYTNHSPFSESTALFMPKCKNEMRQNGGVWDQCGINKMLGTFMKIGSWP